MNLHHLLAGALAFVVLLLSPEAAEAAAATAVADKSLIAIGESDFGLAFPYEDVRVSTTLTNTSDQTLAIRVKPRLASDKVLMPKPLRLEPGANASIDVQIQTGDGAGRIAKYFDVFAGQDDAPIGSFAVRGFVDWVVDPASISVDFGNIDLDSGVTRTIPVKTSPGASLRLEKVLDEGAHFRAEIQDDGKSIRLISKKDAPLGLFDEHLLLAASNSSQKKVGVRVRGQFVTRLVPSSNPVDFGLLRIGDTSEQIVRLEEIDGKPVRVGSIRSEGSEIKAVLQDCIPSNAACRNLRLQLPAQKVRGQVGGIVYLELLPSKKEFPIHFGMVVVGKDTQIRSFEEDQKAAAEAEPAVSDLLKSAIRKPAAPLEMPKPPGTGPLLTWQATNEYGVFGYEIYRGPSKSGPFERVSDQFVKRLDVSGNVGSIYRWRDVTAKSGATYYYYVGIVYEDGRKRDFTTPQEIIAK